MTGSDDTRSGRVARAEARAEEETPEAIAILGLFGAAALMAPPALPSAADLDEYHRLAARLVDGDTTVDVRRLRQLYARTGAARGGPDPVAVLSRAKTEPDAAARRLLLASLQRAYGGLRVVHESVGRVFRKVGELEDAGRVDAIVAAFEHERERWDGRTSETAVEVVAVAEERAWLRARGIRVTRQSLARSPTGGRLDRMEGIVGTTGEAVVAYFSVDWMDRE